MPVTKSSFRGERPVEQRDGSSAQDLIVNMTGAKAMQSSISKGSTKGMVGPGHDPIPPRQLFSAYIGGVGCDPVGIRVAQQ